MLSIRFPIKFICLIQMGLIFGAVLSLQACTNAASGASQKTSATYTVSVIVAGIQEPFSINYNGEIFDISENGRHILATNLEDESSYLISISSPTLYQRCSSNEPSGVINQANIELTIACGRTWYFTATNTLNGNELYKTDGTELGTEMVSDINPGAGSSQIKNITETTNGIVFAADNSANGQELWVSNGEDGGTRILKEFSTGNASTDIGEIHKLNGLALFQVTYNNDNNKEIWISDGSNAGTTMAWSYEISSNKFGITSLSIIGTHAFFIVDDQANLTMSTYRIDGTAQGVEKIAEYKQGVPGITPFLRFVSFGISQSHYFYMIRDHSTLPKRATIWGINESNPDVTKISDFTFSTTEEANTRKLLGDADNKVLFALMDTVNSGGLEPFSFDPLSKTVALYANINSTSSANSYPETIGTINGELVFSAYDGTSTKLWVTDANSGQPALLSDQYFIDAPDAPAFLAQTDNLLYFVAFDFLLQKTLWRTDGTTAGTFALNPQGVLSANVSNIEYLGTVGQSILLSIGSAEYGQEIWLADGTPTGTHLVKDIYPGTTAALSNQGSAKIKTVNDVVYFAAEQGAYGRELWRTDGTEQGTYLVKDINQGSSRSSTPKSLVALNDSVFFTADDGVNGSELWTYGPNGLRLVADINTPTTESGLANDPELDSNPSQLTATDGQVFFVANDGINGHELWRTDGATTYLVQDIGLGSGNGNVTQLTPFGNSIYFTARDSAITANNNKAWISDGSAAGTHILNTWIGGPQYGTASNLTVVGSTLFFRADSGNVGDLWEFDGISFNIVTKINQNTTGNISANPQYFYAFANKLMFQANDGVNGAELWTSDGTPTGTTMISDIALGGLSSDPKEFAKMGGYIYFSANDTGNAVGNELWRTNGETGLLNITELVMDINPQAGQGSRPTDLTLVVDASGQEALFFLADQVDTGLELWKTDGTLTEPVKDILLGIPSSGISDMVAMTGKLYFVANDGTHGRELWVSDGSATGTFMVKDIQPGGTGAEPNELTVVGNLLYFAATDDKDGRELWQSDGTKVGTVLVGNINAIGDAFGP